MRAICKVCKDKETCSYIKRNREGDCIDVQTSDYGYEEAVEKACEWIRQTYMDDYAEDDCHNSIRFDTETFLDDFKQAMLGV